jgi:two-component system, LuxR family, sensor kinase FixL
MQETSQIVFEPKAWYFPLINWHKNWSGWLILSIGLSLVAFVIIHYLDALNIDQTKIYSDWMQGICAVAATVLGWRVTRHPKLNKSTKKAFLILTGSYFAFAFGALYWIFFNCILGKTPYLSLGDSFADAGFLGMYPLMIWALFAFPTKKKEKIGTKLSLDITIVALAIMTLLWHFVVFPSLDKIDDGQWFSTIFKLLYPFGDCCLLVGSLKLLKNGIKGVSKVSMSIFAWGITVLATGDVGFNYLSLHKDYQPGHIIESAWFLSLFLFCLSSFYQYEKASVPKSDRKEQVATSKSWFDSDWIIYTAIILVSVVLLFEASPYWGSKIGFTVFAAFGLSGLIIARQVFALKENSRLFSLQYKQHTELRFLNLIQNSSDLILVFNEGGFITYESPSTKRILGYPKGEMLGKHSLTYIHPEDMETIRGKFVEFLQNPLKEGVSECRVLKADNTWLMMEGRIKFFVNEDNGEKGVVLNANDITARKEAENKVNEFNLKLQQSNRELNDFAHIASHDLQEPLRKIQTFGSRLASKDHDNLSENGKDYLERMQNAANRMQTLIIDLLSFSRLSKEIELFHQTDLNKIAREVLSDLEVKIEETKAIVTIKNLPVIDAEPTQIRQLIQNLIGNALKFQKPNTVPTVDIYTEEVENDAKFGNLNKKYFRLIVKDNGIGFEEKAVEKIFTVFQRLHGREQYEGSGIGLSVCRKIAEHHNGNITAESVPNQGAKFIVTLPYTQKASENW